MAYRRHRQKAVAATEQTVGTSNELVCDSSAREVISVESDEHREGRIKRTRQHESMSTSMSTMEWSPTDRANGVVTY